MQKTTERSGAKERNVKAILIGVLISCAVFVVLTLILAGVMCSSGETRAVLYYAEYAAAAFAGLVCGFITARKGKGKGIVLGAASGVLLTIIILLPLLAVYGAEVSLNLLLILPVVLLLSVLGGVLSANLR